MNKELELAKKFILEYLPPEALAPVTDLFNLLDTDPEQTLYNGLMYSRLHHFKSPDKPLAIASINSFVAGFALAYCIKFPGTVRMVEGYLEAQNKKRGENVVNFFHKKGSK